MRNYKLIFLAVILLGFVGFGVKTVTKANNKLKFKDIQIESKQSDLLQTELKFQQLNTNLKKELESKTQDQEKIKQLEEEKRQLQEKEQKLQADLQAKKEQKAKDLAVKTQQAAQATYKPQTVSAASGNCQSWMAQAGVPNSYAANELIRRESGCNPYAVNKSSGACGIPQNINGCTTYDPVEQLKWMQSYITRRYSTWENAVAFHNANNWY